MLSKWVRKYDGKCQKHTHFQAKVPYDKERFDLRCAVPLYNGIILYEKLPSKEELWLHGCARTTEAIRRAIQDSKESIAKLAEHYSLNPKTIVKWKKRSFIQDIKMGPKQPKSTVLTQEEEAIIVAFRKHTLLPLDDCLYSLQSTIPHLTRSSLHRCLQRHGISRLPDVEGEVKTQSKFKQYPIGYFHIDIAEVRTEEGKLCLFVAIGRTSKFAYVEFHESATKTIAAEFLRNLIKILPYKIHTILTDNGIQLGASQA